MWYLIGIVAIVLVGFFVYASIKKHKQSINNSKKADKPPFRTEEELNTYNKPLDDKHSHVDFDDGE